MMFWVWILQTVSVAWSLASGEHANTSVVNVLQSNYLGFGHLHLKYSFCTLNSFPLVLRITSIIVGRLLVGCGILARKIGEKNVSITVQKVGILSDIQQLPVGLFYRNIQ